MHEGLSEFLSKLKTCKIIICNNNKNRQTRLAVGITTVEQEEIIRSLTVADYHSGPEDDLDPNSRGKVWVFKKCIYRKYFYIKAKEIQIKENYEYSFVYSCHIDNMIFVED